jgi:hypothetical protein
MWWTEWANRNSCCQRKTAARTMTIKFEIKKSHRNLFRDSFFQKKKKSIDLIDSVRLQIAAIFFFFVSIFVCIFKSFSLYEAICQPVFNLNWSRHYKVVFQRIMTFTNPEQYETRPGSIRTDIKPTAKSFLSRNVHIINQWFVYLWSGMQ